ncbi:MAG: 30S ribosomal protein S6 [bacterium]|nr:30S ribosomal protein S6 [bacterium]
MASEPTLYEITYLLKTEAEAASEFPAEPIKKQIEDRKGIILEELKAHKIRLSYPIKKQTEAIHGAFKFMMKTEELEALKESLAKVESILRYILAHAKLRETRRPAFGAKAKEPRGASADVAIIDKKLDELLGK